MPCSDLHKGPNTIRRAANLVFRVKVLGFLHALHNTTESDVSIYMCRVQGYCIYGTLRTQRRDFDVGPFVRVVSCVGLILWANQRRAHRSKVDALCPVRFCESERFIPDSCLNEKPRKLGDIVSEILSRPESYPLSSVLAHLEERTF
jgi:hypothetical protein